MNQKLISLLLNSLHQDQNRLDIEKLKKLSAEEWDELLVLARELRVPALLYQNLKDRGLEEIIPEEKIAILKKFYTRNTIRNLRYMGELKKIVEACDEKEIPVLALKGIYLANTIYKNIGLREMNDIDLLVPKTDLAETADIMLTLGYKPETDFSLDWEYTFNHLPPFFKSGIKTEIHWSIATKELSPKFDIQDFWDQAVPVEIANTKLFSLPPDDILLYLCFHNAKHSFAFTLRPYVDILATIEHFSDELNWDNILKCAQKWGWARGVYLSLRMAKEFLGAEVPNRVLESLNPKEDTEKFYAIAKSQTFANKMLSQEINPNIANYTQLSLGKKAMFLLQRFFPSRIEMANKYHTDPDSLAIFLKYPLRWRDLFIKHSGILVDIQNEDNEVAELAKRKGEILDWLQKNES